MFFRKKLVVTHSGTFHPDDVFAVAVLSFLHKGRIKVIRTRDQQTIDRADYVVDVGAVYDVSRQRFDHHQVGGAGARPNGVPYASFGLVWKEYGPSLCGSPEASDKIDKELVSYIDTMDNGVGKPQPVVADVYSYDISRIISSLNPTWKEDLSPDDTFKKATNYAKKFLERFMIRAAHGREAYSLVKAAYDTADDKRIVVLDRDIPWQEFIAEKPKVLFVVGVRGDGSWGVEAVKRERIGFEVRKPLPAAWGGMRDEEFSKAAGISDGVFCHTKLFLAVARSRESAIALARMAVEV